MVLISNCNLNGEVKINWHFWARTLMSYSIHDHVRTLSEDGQPKTRYETIIWAGKNRSAKCRYSILYVSSDKKQNQDWSGQLEVVNEYFILLGLS